jgi:hypothetical protein
MHCDDESFQNLRWRRHTVLSPGWLAVVGPRSAIQSACDGCMKYECMHAGHLSFSGWLGLLSWMPACMHAWSLVTISPSLVSCECDPRRCSCGHHRLWLAQNLSYNRQLTACSGSEANWHFTPLRCWSCSRLLAGCKVSRCYIRCFMGCQKGYLDTNKKINYRTRL